MHELEKCRRTTLQAFETNFIFAYASGTCCFYGNFQLNQSQAAPPKRLQSFTLKLETASLKTSDIGRNPDCAAGVAIPAPTELALSLKGLQP